MSYEETLDHVRVLSERYPDPVTVAREWGRSAVTRWLRSRPWRPARALTEADVVKLLKHFPKGER